MGLSDATKKKISDANKGRAPWNKGNKTPICIRCSLNPTRHGRICDRCWYLDRKARFLAGEPIILRTRGKYSINHFPRAKAIKLYGSKCQKCQYNEHPEILVLHHKDRNHRNNKTDNWEILCPNCHYLTHYQTKSGMFSRLK